MAEEKDMSAVIKWAAERLASMPSRCLASGCFAEAHHEVTSDFMGGKIHAKYCAYHATMILREQWREQQDGQA